MASSPGVLAVRRDVASTATLGAEGGVGDAPWFCVLPRTQDPADRTPQRCFEPCVCVCGCDTPADGAAAPTCCHPP